MKSKNKHNEFPDFPSDFILAQKFAYEPSGLIGINFRVEEESQEYGAINFEMAKRQIKFRLGKITPVKIGHFITFWKRIGTGPILPYDVADQFDLLIVSVRNREHLGQFVFPKGVLCEKGIVSKEGRGGKRAMRVYPAWDIVDNRQAKETQTWQLPYFFEVDAKGFVDISRVQRLFLHYF